MADSQPFLSGGDCHVIPEKDAMVHISSEACPCRPALQVAFSTRIFVHKAADGREAGEAVDLHNEETPAERQERLEWERRKALPWFIYSVWFLAEEMQAFKGQNLESSYNGLIQITEYQSAFLGTPVAIINPRAISYLEVAPCPPPKQ